MIEIILILGLLFVLGLIAYFHYLSTTNNTTIRELTNTNAIPELHPWYIAIECILGLTILYLCGHVR